MLAPLRCNFQRLSQVTVYSQHLRHARRPFKRLGLPANGLHATMAPPRSKLQFVGELLLQVMRSGDMLQEQPVHPCCSKCMSCHAADIGANLTDGMFQGQYMGKQYHSPDLPRVLERAWSAGMTVTLCLEHCMQMHLRKKPPILACMQTHGMQKECRRSSSQLAACQRAELLYSLHRQMVSLQCLCQGSSTTCKASCLHFTVRHNQCHELVKLMQFCQRTQFAKRCSGRGI